MQVIYNKSTANIILNGEKLKAFPLKSGKRQGAHSYHYYSTECGSLCHRNQRIKINKRNPDWKRRKKLSLFADDIIFYLENPKDTTRKLLELINE